MPAALKAVSGTLEGRVLVLPPAGEPFVVGAALEADLTIHGGDLDERHALLVPDGSGHRIVPVARGGTRLRGAPLLAATALREGDLIEFGPNRFVYCAAAGVEALELARVGATVPCALCGQPAGEGALRLGGEVACARCVDRRLAVDRGIESYKVLRKIGQNEDEVTYLAVEKETGDRVGLRLLKADRGDPGLLRRFLARSLAGLVLGHPAYLEVRAVRHARGITFAAVDLPDGGAGTKLERLVRARQPLSAAGALKVVDQLAGVLRFARGRRLVVAKRKRTGVVVGRRLDVHVLSFDITRELEEAAVATAAFRHVVSGAGLDADALIRARPRPPRNPEEARLGQLATEPAEVYSLGRILYQLGTGRPLLPAVTLQELRAATTRHAAGRPLDPGATPGAQALERLPRPVVDLLDRVLVPAGDRRVTTLEGLEQASAQVKALLGDQAQVGLELETSDVEDADDV